MKHADTRAALDHHELMREPDERGEIYRLPAEVAPVHALLKPQASRSGTAERRWERHLSPLPVFLDGSSAERAACGVFVKVVLPLLFDDEPPECCPRCCAEVVSWVSGPAAWWTRRRQREDRSQQRKEEEEDIELWEAREGRGDFLGGSH